MLSLKILPNVMHLKMKNFKNQFLEDRRKTTNQQTKIPQFLIL